MKRSEINRALRELELMCRQEHCYEGYFHTYTTNDLHLTFDVLYEPGTLKAVGYRNREPVMTETVETRCPADRHGQRRYDGLDHVE